LDFRAKNAIQVGLRKKAALTILYVANIDSLSFPLLRFSKVMELLLNILWVLLAVPAILVWLRAPEHRLASKSGVCSFLVLGCVLLLLFPVISASDDLHAMRPEIEESSASKKVAMHAVAPHASAVWGRLALAVSSVALAPQINVWGQVTNLFVPLSLQLAQNRISARAPPAGLS
jgi:hypothetical protein